MRLSSLLLAAAAAICTCTADDATNVAGATQNDGAVECACPVAVPLPPRGSRCEPLYAGMGLDGNACEQFTKEDCSNPIVGASVGMTCPQMCSCKGEAPTSTTRTSTTRTTTTKTYTSTTRTTSTKTSTTKTVSTTTVSSTTGTVTSKTSTTTASTTTVTVTTVSTTTATTVTPASTGTTGTSTTIVQIASVTSTSESTPSGTTLTATPTTTVDVSDYGSGSGSDDDEASPIVTSTTFVTSTATSETSTSATSTTSTTETTATHTTTATATSTNNRLGGAFTTSPTTTTQTTLAATSRITSTVQTTTKPSTTTSTTTLTTTSSPSKTSTRTKYEGFPPELSSATTMSTKAATATATTPTTPTATATSSTTTTTATLNTTRSTATKSTTRTTETTETTATPICNGLPDPDLCKLQKFELCYNNITSAQLKLICPVLCGSCASPASTTTGTEPPPAHLECNGVPEGNLCHLVDPANCDPSVSNADVYAKFVRADCPVTCGFCTTSSTAISTSTSTSTTSTSVTTQTSATQTDTLSSSAATASSTTIAATTTADASDYSGSGNDDDDITTSTTSTTEPPPPNSTAAATTTTTATAAAATATSTTTPTPTKTTTTTTFGLPFSVTIPEVPFCEIGIVDIIGNCVCGGVGLCKGAECQGGRMGIVPWYTAGAADAECVSELDCNGVLPDDHLECQAFTEADCTDVLFGESVRSQCIHMCKVCETARTDSTVVVVTSTLSSTTATEPKTPLAVGGSASGSGSGSGSSSFSGFQPSGVESTDDDGGDVFCDGKGDSPLCASFTAEDCKSALMSNFMHPNCPYLCGLCTRDGNDDGAKEEATGSGNDFGSGDDDDDFNEASGNDDDSNDAEDGATVSGSGDAPLDGEDDAAANSGGDDDNGSEVFDVNLPSPDLVGPGDALVCVYAVSSGGRSVEDAAAAAAANVAAGTAVSSDPMGDVVDGVYSAFPAVCRDPAGKPATLAAQSNPTRMAEHFFDAGSPLMKGYHCDEELWAGPDHCDCIVIGRPGFATYADWIGSCCDEASCEKGASTASSAPPFATPAPAVTMSGRGITGKAACGCAECIRCSDEGRCDSIYPVCYAQSINIAVVLEHGVHDGGAGLAYSADAVANAQVFLRRLFEKFKEELAKPEPRVDRIQVHVAGVSTTKSVVLSADSTENAELVLDSFDRIEQHRVPWSMWHDFDMGAAILAETKRVLQTQAAEASMSAIVVFADGSTNSSASVSNPSFHTRMSEFTQLDFGRRRVVVDGGGRVRRADDDGGNSNSAATAQPCECNVCNGFPDPLNCQSYSAAHCADLVVGSAVSFACPALCGTCVSAVLRLVFETLDIAEASLGTLGDSIRNAVLSVGNIPVGIKYASGSIIAELTPATEAGRALLQANLLRIRNDALDSYVAAMAAKTTGPPASTSSAFNFNNADLASSDADNSNSQAAAGAGGSLTWVAALLTTIVVVIAIIFVGYAVRNYQKVRGSPALNPNLNNLYQLNGEIEDLQSSIQPGLLDRTTSENGLATPARRTGFPMPGAAGRSGDTSFMSPFSMDGSGAADVLQSPSVARLVESRKKMNATMAAAFDLISSPIYSFSDPNNSSVLPAFQADPGLSVVSEGGGGGGGVGGEHHTPVKARPGVRDGADDVQVVRVDSSHA